MSIPTLKNLICLLDISVQNAFNCSSDLTPKLKLPLEIRKFGCSHDSGLEWILIQKDYVLNNTLSSQ